MNDQLIETKLLQPEVLLKQELAVEIGHHIGDLGCGGAGYFALPAARMVGPKGKVYAVDILKSALEGVKSKATLENMQNIETVWSDLERLGATKIPAGSLDEALLINILFQSRANETLLTEAHRLLKVGGKLLIVDWKVIPTPLGPPVNVRLTPEVIIELATKVGYTIAKQFEASAYHYALILTK